MPQPPCVSGEPLPASARRPATKSVAWRGTGSGSQRSWLGDAATSSKRLLTQRAARGANNRQRIPAQLVGRRRHLIEAVADPARRARRELPVHGGRPDAIQPAAAVAVAGSGECRAGELLGV